MLAIMSSLRQGSWLGGDVSGVLLFFSKEAKTYWASLFHLIFFLFFQDSVVILKLTLILSFSCFSWDCSCVLLSLVG